MKKEEQCGVVYECECDNYGKRYIGETGRSLQERMDKQQKSLDKRDEKSALSQHQEKAWV